MSDQGRVITFNNASPVIFFHSIETDIVVISGGLNLVPILARSHFDKAGTPGPSIERPITIELPCSCLIQAMGRLFVSLASLSSRHQERL